MNGTDEESENEYSEESKSQSERSASESEKEKPVRTDDEEDADLTDDEEDADLTDDEEGAVGVTKAPAEKEHLEEEDDSYKTEGETSPPPIYPTPPPDDGSKIPATKPERRKRNDTVLEMAMDAIEALNNRNGSSVRAIVKYLKSNGHPMENEQRFFKLLYKVLKLAVASGQVTQNKFSFKLSQSTKNERKALEKMKANKAKAEKKARERAKEQEEKVKAKEEAKAKKAAEEENPKPTNGAKPKESKTKAKSQPKAKPKPKAAKASPPSKEKPAKPSERKTNQPRKKTKTNEGAASAATVATTSNKAAAGAAVLAAMEMAGPSTKRPKKIMTKLVFDDDEDSSKAPEPNKGKGGAKINMITKKPVKKNLFVEGIDSKTFQKQMEAKTLPELPDEDQFANVLVSQATSTPQSTGKKKTRKRK